MPNYKLSERRGDIHLEDANIDDIRRGLAIIAGSGISAVAQAEVEHAITIYECAECERKWTTSDPLHYLPGWSLQNSGRGRKTKLEEVTKALEGWSSGKGTMCEPCLMKQADKYAHALLTLDNKSLKRFFHVYGAQIAAVKRDKGKGFFDWYGHRFHVKFITVVFEALPHRKKTAFHAMTTVMKELELI